MSPSHTSTASARLASLSVFFPCLNEEKNVPIFVKEALDVLPKFAKKFEIIIVNDGSTDRTQQVAEELARTHRDIIKVVSHPKNRGYGASVRTGFATAKYDWVFFTDGDLQFRLAQLKTFIPHAKKYDAIIGVRKKRAEGFSRSRNAKLFKLYIDLLFRLDVKDIDCAFKLFRRSTINSITLESNGAFISSELLYKLKKQKVSMKQIPVDHFPRQYGSPTGANFRVIIRACVESMRLYLHMKFKLFSGAQF